MAGKRPPLSLKGRALALLAQREHSVAELRRKLLRHARAPAGASSDTAAEPVDGEQAAAQVDALIAWLQSHRYLSEERFVESRIHARVSRYGNLRIRQELAQHGLSVPAEVAQSLKASELERATEVWRRRFGTPPADAAERARQMRFLAQRGFSQDTIVRVIRHCEG
jgi:regulatory protein